MSIECSYFFFRSELFIMLKTMTCLQIVQQFHYLPVPVIRIKLSLCLVARSTRYGIPTNKLHTILSTPTISNTPPCQQNRQM